MVIEAKGANDRIYRFECEPDAPLGEVHDALFTLKEIVLKQIHAASNEEKVPEKEECPEECSKELEDQPEKEDEEIA